MGKGKFLVPVVLGMLLQLQGVSAATFTVTNNGNSGPETLRAAIEAANADGDADAITITVTGEIVLTAPLPALTSPVSITGPGAASLAIRRSAAPGTPDFRIFEFTSPAASLSGVTIANGAANQGAGIWNRNQLVLRQCVVTANLGRGAGSGAGVKNSGNLLVDRCVISGNLGLAAGFRGGGIDTSAGELTGFASTISGNQAGADGGGLFVGPGASFIVALTNCTLSGNTASGVGGGVFCAGGETRLVHCTIASNTAAGRAGGLFVDAQGTAALRSSIIARNINTERPNVAVGTPRGLVSLGHNLIGEENSSAELIDGVNGDIVGNPGNPVDPLLGPLQLNFGPTPTHALLPGSRAINAGNNTGAPATDQQGLPRVAEGTADIGAFESNAGLPPTITCPSNIIVSNAPGQCDAQVTYTVSASGLPEPVVTSSIPSGSVFPMGTTLVTVTASNAVGTTNCSFTVTVVDAEAPALTCPAPITVPEDSVRAGVATVNFPAPLVSDNCGTNLTVTFTPPSGTAFPLGTSTVSCSVADAAGNSNSCTFTVTVLAYTTATIPDDAAVCPGDNVTLLTVPSGTGPFTFAWTKGGVPLPGETNATLSLNNVSAADAATYCAVVSGAVNTVTNCGTVTVNTNTSATALTSLEVCPGTPVAFSTVPSGTGPFSFAWLKDGTPIAGETNASFAITNTQNADAGGYSVIVAGLCTAVTNSATLTVWTNTSASALSDLAVCPGTPVSFSTVAAGTGPFSFVWLKDGTPIAGETSASFAITNTLNADAAVYSVVVQGFCTAVTNSANLTVWTNTAATSLTSLEVCPGTPVGFSTIPSGTGPFAFSWFKDGAPITDATNALLELTNVVNGSEGVYSVVVQGLCTAVTNAATLTVWTNTAATALTSLEVCPGTTVAFSTVPSGTGPFSFAWFKDGSPINGETNPVFALTNTLNADAAVYSVVVQGLCTAVTNSATLTVWTNLSFAATPPVDAPPRTDANICSPAIGTGPVAYQWFRNGNAIPGATTDCLTLTNVSLPDEGDYCVVATGLCTSATNCVTFAIRRDGTPPAIASANILCSSNSAGLTQLLVAFTEELVPATALNLANYSIPGLTITNIAGAASGNTYLLETDAPFRCGFNYGLVVSGIQDISGEIQTAAVTNLATDSLPCCNNSYVLALPAGYSLVANQLDRGYNTLSDVLPEVPVGSFVQVLSATSPTNGISADGYPANPQYDTFTYGAGGWSGNPVLNPGSGFFIFVPTPTNLVLSGSLPVITLPLPFPDSLELVSRQAPIAGGFEDLFGAPPVEGIAVYTHVSTNPPSPVQPPNFERHLFRRGVWEGGAPMADVGEAWFVQAIQPVVITTNPVSQEDVTFGSTISFSVAATGSPELRYQWRHNGINLPGKTNSTLVIPNVQLADGGAYSVTVGNFFNTVESSTAVLSLLVFDLPDLPLTNNYADRVVLTAPSGLGNSSNVGASQEPGEPNHAGKPGGKSMWIDWQAPANGIVVIATTGSSFDTLLAVYTNGPAGLVEVASDEESGGFLTSKLSFYATAGQTYSIAVDGFGGEQGVIVLGWSLEVTQDKLPIIVQPPQSIVAGLGDTVVFTALAAGQDISYQWFFNGASVAPPQRQSPGNKDELRIKNAGPQDAGIYVVRLFEGSRFIDSQPISLQFNMEGLAKTVRRTLTTDKLLDVFTIPAPVLARDALAEADGAFAAAGGSGGATVQRSYTGTQIFNTYGAVKQPGEPNHCGVPGGASQWFLYEPPDNGTAFINTDGSTFNTVLAVYTGPGDSFATLVEVACDKNSGSNGITSSVSFPAALGTPYYVVVDTENGSTGIVNLNYTMLIPIVLTNLALTPSGDFRVTANVTPELPFTVQRTTNFSTWVPILTNLSTNGTYQFIDSGSRSNSRVSYRLLQKP